VLLKGSKIKQQRTRIDVKDSGIIVSKSFFMASPLYDRIRTTGINIAHKHD
jgi:hypothetical protein